MHYSLTISGSVTTGSFVQCNFVITGSAGGSLYSFRSAPNFRCLYPPSGNWGVVRRPLSRFGCYPGYNSTRFRIRGRGSGRYTSYNFICCFGPSSTAITLVLGRHSRLLIYHHTGRPTGKALSLPKNFVSVARANRRNITHRMERRANVGITGTRCLFSLPGVCVCSNFPMRALSVFFHYAIRSALRFRTVSSTTSLFFLPLGSVHARRFKLNSVHGKINVFLRSVQGGGDR